MNRLQQIEARMAEIRAALDTEGADLDALEAEITALTEERASIEAAIEKRAALVKSVATGAMGRTIRTFVGTEPGAQEAFDVNSPEFRSAWLKKMAHNSKTGEWRLGQLTEVEERAFTYTTATTPNAIPGAVSLGIVDMIAKQYAVLGDIVPTEFADVVEFVQTTAIVSGAAAATAQNVANAEDLQITFVKVTMTGVEIRGDVVIGAKMRIQSMDGFEAYLVGELSREMGERMNDHVVAAIEADMVAGNKVATGAGVALTAADVKSALALLKGGRGQRVAYANSHTIWNHIAGVVDSTGKEKFIESSVTDDPAVQGRIYGTVVKLDETLADNLVYIGFPATVKANTFVAPNVLSDINVKTRETTYGGYALFEAHLGDTRAFVKLTCTPAAVS